MSEADAEARGLPDDDREWHGETVRYDLVKEFVVALALITALAVILAILFSSPDDPPTTIQQWARSDPGDFLATIYHHLGIDYARTLIRDFNGRPTAIVDHGRAIPELIG